MMERKLLLLVDYRDTFYSSIKNAKTLCTLDVPKLKGYFEQAGYQVKVVSFTRVDFGKDYNGWQVLYTSSEDYGLRYKSYIEDVLLHLCQQGAILLPDFVYFRAHHNKSFMEMLRYRLFPEETRKLQTRFYGTYEELEADIERMEERKYVVKTAFGAGGKYVRMAEGKEQLRKICRKLSKGRDLLEPENEWRKKLLWRGYHPRSLHRNKFIVQNMIEGLAGDIKVLKYGDKFYPLFRKNRENDFRASGSGRLSFEIPGGGIEISEFLNFAKKVSDIIHSPLCSMDIAYDGIQYWLIEFQCLNFGTYAAEKSKGYYTLAAGVDNSVGDNSWNYVMEECDVEKNICEAVERWQLDGYEKENCTVYSYIREGGS